MSQRPRNTRRRRASRRPRTVSRSLAWVFTLAIVFSIGLIAGQRLLDSESAPPLISTSSTARAKAPDQRSQGGEVALHARSREDVSFSFYERLGHVSAGQRASKKAPPTLSDALDGALDLQRAEALPARYTLQLGAHPSMDKAQRHVAQLAKQGIEAHVIANAEPPKKSKIYRVRVGKFHSMDEARQFQGALKSQRELDTFVMPL